MDPIVQQCLAEYKEKVDSKKPDEFSNSTYRVEKNWGYEVWLTVNEFYTMKLIHMKKGHRCSLQSHQYKFETNYVLEGEAEVIVQNKLGNLETKIFNPGEGWTVPTNRIHRLIAKTDITILECSTTHLNDVIRHQDDYNRPNGKIDTEHK